MDNGQKDILGSKNTVHRGTHRRPHTVDHTKAHREAPARGPVRARLAVNGRKRADLPYTGAGLCSLCPQLCCNSGQIFLLFDSHRQLCSTALLRTFDFVLGSKNHAPHKVLKAQFNCLACYIAVTTGHRSCCPVAQIGHLRLSEVKQLGPRDKFQSQAAELKA